MDAALISDRAEITDLMNRYALAVDLRDWPAYRSCFTDEIELSSPGWPAKIGADEWVERITAGMIGFKATQHQMSNYTIDVTGDEAHCITYIRATHLFPTDQGDSRWTIVGYYDNGLVRTADGWKIRRFKLTNLWNEGNYHLRTLAAKPPGTER